MFVQGTNISMPLDLIFPALTPQMFLRLVEQSTSIRQHNADLARCQRIEEQFARRENSPNVQLLLRHYLASVRPKLHHLILLILPKQKVVDAGQLHVRGLNLS